MSQIAFWKSKTQNKTIWAKSKKAEIGRFLYTQEIIDNLYLWINLLMAGDLLAIKLASRNGKEYIV
jgi:hypothetical protein